MTSGPRGLVVALSGGIGGAKLALGLSRVVPAEDLLIIGNTGDDFEHLGLSISPDLDTLMYTLAGVANPETGWGRAGETWAFMAALEGLDGETWFRLGDRDLATHVERTRRLREGETLSGITRDLCRRLGVPARIAPMSDGRVRTRVLTPEGWLDFQDYFVRLRCEPVVRALEFEGAATAAVLPEILDALNDPRLRAVVVCPSNPFISIDPILAVRGMRAALAGCAAPVVAVSPIVGQRAVKGPTAKMMSELGHVVSAASVARYYADILDGYILDGENEHEAPDVPMPMVTAQTLMTTMDDRITLARAVLAFADRLSAERPRP